MEEGEGGRGRRRASVSVLLWAIEWRYNLRRSIWLSLREYCDLSHASAIRTTSRRESSPRCTPTGGNPESSGDHLDERKQAERARVRSAIGLGRCAS